MKNTDNFRYAKLGESHHMVPPNRHILQSTKDEWGTKDDTGKSMKNALQI